ncbi:MAG: RIP metalloprotease [Hyphomicrobiaceae bacterium]
MNLLTFVVEQLQPFGAFLLYATAFLFVLTVVVFVHELGHFLVARWCGVKVDVFSIGFGREIFGFNDRYGTRWKFSWIPLGGYVKFMDDDDPTSSTAHKPAGQMTAQERAGSFHLKPLWQRASVVAAGPIANFIFAIVVFALMFWTFGERVTAPKVDAVVEGLPAAQAGIQAGDVVREINGAQIRSFNDLQRFVGTSIGQPLTVVVDRGGSLVTLQMTPVGREMDDGIGGKMTRGVIGIQRSATPESYVVNQPGPVEAIGLGVRETGFVITSTLGYLRDIVFGRQDAQQIGGVIRIAEATRQVVDLRPEMLPHFIALISVSIGLINLFPIPLLDGGHLMFYAIEAVRRRPLSERTQELAFRMGLAVVLALMAFAFWNDRFIPLRWIGASG